VQGSRGDHRHGSTRRSLRDLSGAPSGQPEHPAGSERHRRPVGRYRDDPESGPWRPDPQSLGSRCPPVRRQPPSTLVSTRRKTHPILDPQPVKLQGRHTLPSTPHPQSLATPLCYASVVQILDLAAKWLLRTKANDVKGLLRLHGVVTTFLKMHKKTLRRADIRWAFICFAVDTYSAKENHLYQTH
jgi:hypothetical protein